LFSEAVALYEPILPVCDAVEGDGAASAPPDRVNATPALSALRLHHGTVWKWNRPVYDPADGGHLRIELRALPAGPTVDDMLANAAFLVGGILGLATDVASLLPAFPFALAERNFYRAAQHGLDAELGWPRAPGEAPAPVRARDLLLSLLPRAEAGLLAGGVARDEVRHYLDLFERRVRAGVTGAIWQLRALAALRDHGVAPREAQRRLVERYLHLSGTGQPVHAWPIEE
jgi:hypothetical protein